MQKEPLARKEPPTQKGPLTQREPLAQEESLAQKEPLAQEGPPEQPEVAGVPPPPNVFMTPTSKTVYHLSKACQHIGDHSHIVRACKDCLREKACEDLRQRQKTM